MCVAGSLLHLGLGSPATFNSCTCHIAVCGVLTEVCTILASARQQLNLYSCTCHSGLLQRCGLHCSCLSPHGAMTAMTPRGNPPADASQFHNNGRLGFRQGPVDKNRVGIQSESKLLCDHVLSAPTGCRAALQEDVRWGCSVRHRVCWASTFAAFFWPVNFPTCLFARLCSLQRVLPGISRLLSRQTQGFQACSFGPLLELSILLQKNGVKGGSSRVRREPSGATSGVSRLLFRQARSFQALFFWAVT